MRGFFKRYPNLKTVLIFAAIYFLLPFIVNSNYYLTTLTLFLINSLLISSLMVIVGYAGQISLAHGAIYGLGAYVSAILTTRFGFTFVLGVLVSTILGFLISMVVGAPSLRLKGHFLAMATLGIGEIVYILFKELDWLTGGVNGLTGIKAATIGVFSFKDPLSYYYLVYLLTILALTFLSLLLDGKIGRALKAIKSSEIAALTLGLNPSSYKLLAFSIAGMMAAGAGALYAHLDRFVSPSSFSLSLSVMLLSMVIVGGESSLAGSLAAAAFFSFLNEYVRQFQELSQLFFGLALLIVVLYFRGGFSEAYRRLLSLRRRSRVNVNENS
jgi:branched-chain amino acid transport system permease protein